MSRLLRKTFEDFYLSDGMIATLAEIDYVDPTPVQAATIPLVMAGIDLIVQSQTGTGKTAAFAIPIVEMMEPNPGVIEVLILAPTRELAKQVSEEFGRLGAFKGLNVATIYGGTGYEAQYRDLETAQIVTATPGRLIDLIERGKADLSNVRVFGLDEADEMLSMGFQEEVDRVISNLPEERQSLLFSATITSDVKSLGSRMLYYPEFVTLSSDSVAAADVTHQYYAVDGVGRARDLLKILEYHEPDNAIVFANTKGDTFMVTSFLKRHGLRAEVLNGDLPQKERERTLAALRAGEIDYLVATDVAARGIDISDLSHVINYALPESAEVYIHRTGRTGRAGKKGTAISLLSPREMATLFNIRKHYGVTLERQELPSPTEVMAAKQRRRLADLEGKIDALQSVPYGKTMGLAREILRDDETNRVRLVAKLIALATDGPSRASADAEIAEVLARTATDELDAQQDEAPVAPRPEEPVAVVEDVEPAEVSEPAKRGQDLEARREPEDDGEQTRRRRRRRRDSEEQVEAAPQEEPAAEPRDEAGESDSPRGGRRGRRGRSSRGRGERRDDRPSASAEPRREERTTAPAAPVGHPMSKLWLNVGSEQFESSAAIAEMVCYMAGMDPEDIGEISVENSFSYVEVRDDYFYDIIDAMNKQEWNGVTIAAEPARK